MRPSKRAWQKRVKEWQQGREGRQDKKKDRLTGEEGGLCFLKGFLLLQPAGYEGVTMVGLWWTHTYAHTKWRIRKKNALAHDGAVCPSDICLNSIDLFWQMCEVFQKRQRLWYELETSSRGLIAGSGGPRAFWHISCQNLRAADIDWGRAEEMSEMDAGGLQTCFGSLVVWWTRH